MNAAEVAAMGRPKGLPFRLNKIGHLALYVHDLQQSAKFYTEVLGFQISDVYPEDGGMLPGGAVFVRLNADHHGIALFKATKDYRPGAGLHHIAFEVSSLDEVLRVRDHLRKHDVRIHFECSSRSSSRTRTGTIWRSTGASTRSARTAACARRSNGRARAAWRRRLRTRLLGRTPACGTSRCLAGNGRLRHLRQIVRHPYPRHPDARRAARRHPAPRAGCPGPRSSR
jgi:catechol 2,3-dioxygenase-like lactoylglutathione lyase family enzyme